MIVAADWLEGSIEVPFPIVGAVVGLIILGMLIYFVRREPNE